MHRVSLAVAGWWILTRHNATSLSPASVLCKRDLLRLRNGLQAFVWIRGGWVGSRLVEMRLVAGLTGSLLTRFA